MGSRAISVTAWDDMTALSMRKDYCSSATTDPESFKAICAETFAVKSGDRRLCKTLSSQASGDTSRLPNSIDISAH